MAAQRKPTPAVASKKSNPSPEPSDLRILKKASCPTVSGKSNLKYEIGYDPEDVVYIRVTEAFGGGFWSKEWVLLSAIRSALSKSASFTSILLFPLFKGKSVNTPGYLLAVLRAEKLIQALPGKTRIHELCPDWDDRVASLLSGDLGKVKPASKPAARKPSASPKTNSKPTKKATPRPR
jgi:hypothetical protein